MLSFAWPWLFALLPLPFIIYRFTPAAKPQLSALRLPSYALLHSQQPTQPGSSRSRLLLASLIWLCLVTAAARPLWLGEPVPLPVQGRDLMLAVDLSGSMEIEDMAQGNSATGRYVDRLTASKAVLGDFIAQRQGDRLGLILFADAAYLQAPLTHDLSTVKRFLDETVIGLVGQSTAIGDAIGLAVKRLSGYDNPDKVLILLTDGENTAGKIEPLSAAKRAAQLGVRIYTIGLGADEILQRSLFGLRRVNPSQDLDEETLQRIAALTGGQYFRARDPEQLQAIYQALEQLEPVDYDTPTMQPEISLFHWPLALALLLSLLPVTLNGLRKVRRLPRDDNQPGASYE